MPATFPFNFVTRSVLSVEPTILVLRPVSCTSSYRSEVAAMISYPPAISCEYDFVPIWPNVSTSSTMSYLVSPRCYDVVPQLINLRTDKIQPFLVRNRIGNAESCGRHYYFIRNRTRNKHVPINTDSFFWVGEEFDFFHRKNSTSRKRGF